VKTRILLLMLFCLIGGSMGILLVNAQFDCHDQPDAWRFSATGASLIPPGFYRTRSGFPGAFGMQWMKDLVCRFRKRTKSSFDINLQGVCCVGCFDHIQLNNPDGMVTATGEIAQPVMFLGVVIARGPPWSGHQNLHPFDGVSGRLARQFCIAPLPSEFPFHDSPSARNATCPSSNHPWRVTMVRCSPVFQSNPTQPFNSWSYYEI
jgi:hypothetical protein